jgi:hypothetical protein
MGGNADQRHSEAWHGMRMLAASVALLVLTSASAWPQTTDKDLDQCQIEAQGSDGVLWEEVQLCMAAKGHEGPIAEAMAKCRRSGDQNLGKCMRAAGYQDQEFECEVDEGDNSCSFECTNLLFDFLPACYEPYEPTSIERDILERMLNPRVERSNQDSRS